MIQADCTNLINKFRDLAALETAQAAKLQSQVAQATEIIAAQEQAIREQEARIKEEEEEETERLGLLKKAAQSSAIASQVELEGLFNEQLTACENEIEKSEKKKERIDYIKRTIQSRTCSDRDCNRIAKGKDGHHCPGS